MDQQPAYSKTMWGKPIRDAAEAIGVLLGGSDVDNAVAEDELNCVLTLGCRRALGTSVAVGTKFAFVERAEFVERFELTPDAKRRVKAFDRGEASFVPGDLIELRPPTPHARGSAWKPSGRRDGTQAKRPHTKNAGPRVVTRNAWRAAQSDSRRRGLS